MTNLTTNLLIVTASLAVTGAIGSDVSADGWEQSDTDFARWREARFGMFIRDRPCSLSKVSSDLTERS